MGFLKSIFLVICILVLFLTSMIFELGLLVDNTVLSNSFFTKIVNSSDIVSAFAGTDKNASGNIDGTESDTDSMDMISSYAGDAVMNWLKAEIPVIINGVHAYIVGGVEYLPVTDITQIKSVIMGRTVDELMARPEFTGQKEQIDKLINILDDKYLARLMKNGVDDKILAEIMARPVVIELELDEDLLTGILNSYMGLKKADVGGDDLVRGIVSDIVENESPFGKIGNSIDMNSVTGKLFGTGYNPVEKLRDLISAFKRVVIIIIPALMFIMMLVFGIVTFRVSSAFKWISAGLILTGVIFSAIAFLVQYLFASGHPVFSFLGVDSAGSSGNMLISAASVAIKSIGGFMLIEGVLTLLAGLLLLLAGLLVDKNMAGSSGQSGKWRAIAYRAPAFVLATILAIVLISATINNSIKSINEFAVNSSQVISNLNNVDIMELFTKK